MERSASVWRSSPSAIDAPHSAMSASVFDAIWSCSDWWVTSAMPIGLRKFPESGESRTCLPPQATVVGPNSWAGSRMMISSSG